MVQTTVCCATARIHISILRSVSVDSGCRTGYCRCDHPRGRPALRAAATMIFNQLSIEAPLAFERDPVNRVIYLNQLCATSRGGQGGRCHHRLCPQNGGGSQELECISRMSRL